MGLWFQGEQVSWIRPAVNDGATLQRPVNGAGLVTEQARFTGRCMVALRLQPRAVARHPKRSYDPKSLSPLRQPVA